MYFFNSRPKRSEQKIPPPNPLHFCSHNNLAFQASATAFPPHTPPSGRTVCPPLAEAEPENYSPFCSKIVRAEARTHHQNAFCFNFIASLGASPLASAGSFQSKLYCLGKFRESFPFRIWRLFHKVKQYEEFIPRADGFRPARGGTARDFHKIVGVISESI